MGGVGSVHTWVACLRGWRASVGYIVGVLTWVARLVWQRKVVGASVGGVGGVLK